MILPENGSVLIIDDDPNQAMPIINALSKKGIATNYYRGFREDELPSKPITSVRLAIVDLQLLPTDNNDHIIATRLVNVLKRLISSENGPYVLLIWSMKDHLFGGEFRKEIKEQNNNLVPVCIVNLEKSACINKVVDSNEYLNDAILDLKGRFDEEDLEAIKESILRNSSSEVKYEAKPDAIQTIELHLKNELIKAGVFHLFVIWENLIRKAGSKMVNNISSTIEYTDLWENNMRGVLMRMAKARTGQNTLSDNLFLKAALTTFSSSFSEELEFEVRKLDFPDYINLESPFSIASEIAGDSYRINAFFDKKGELRCTLYKNENKFLGIDNVKFIELGKKISLAEDNLERKLFIKLAEVYITIPYLINTKLHLELEPTESHIPGNVYQIEVSVERKKELLLTYFSESINDVADFHFVELEVSPICDYAQKKWKKSRLLSGLVYPEAEKLKQGEFFYRNSPVIIIDGNKYRMAFCYLIFKAYDVEKVEKRGKPWFRIKRELLQDIVAGLSSHVNRPGITTMS